MEEFIIAYKFNKFVLRPNVATIPGKIRRSKGRVFELFRVLIQEGIVSFVGVLFKKEVEFIGPGSAEEVEKKASLEIEERQEKWKGEPKETVVFLENRPNDDDVHGFVVLSNSAKVCKLSQCNRFLFLREIERLHNIRPHFPGLIGNAGNDFNRVEFCIARSFAVYQVGNRKECPRKQSWGSSSVEILICIKCCLTQIWVLEFD